MSAKKISYTVEEWAWFYKPRQQPCRTPKWARYYSGPFRIMTLFNNVNVVIQQSLTSQAITTHIDNLKKYYGSPPIDFTITKEQDTVQPSILSESNMDTTLTKHTLVKVPERVDPKPTITTRNNQPVHLPIRYNDYDLQ